MPPWKRQVEEFNQQVALKPLIGRIASRAARGWRLTYPLRARWSVLCSGGVLVWPTSTVAEVPVRVDGQGYVALGEGVHLGYRAAPRLGSGEILLQARSREAKILIGRQTFASNNVAIISLGTIHIGETCQIGDQVAIVDADFHELSAETRNASPGKVVPVQIGNNVWLGSRVLVLKGVSIGDNTVVGAGSVVTRNLPANVVAAGNPARIIRSLASTPA